MGQALYRKYRSKSFDDVVGQDHITKTLQNALGSGRISHAYLFTGPRGVGKTSVARILAHEVNDLPYTDESVHLDIIEIDAASNRRIDEIRDLRDKVNIAPAAAKYKVYIIDEVHMLTREAFNALLKTLEEPPAHCIFILATTEAHKLPETIISRTQRFEFKPVSAQQAAGHLQTIAKREKIDIEPAALELLADFGNGSFRDSISYLDQLSSYSKKITADDVRALLGLPARGEIIQLAENLERADMPGTLKSLHQLESQGIKPAAIAAGLSELIRESASGGSVGLWQISLLRQLLDVPASHRPQDALEISLLSSIADRADAKPQASPVAKSSSENAPNGHPVSGLAISGDEIAEPAAKKPRAAAESETFSLSQWDEIIDRCKKEAASVYTALRLARPDYTDGTLILSFQFPLHQKKLDLAKNKDLVTHIIEEVSGQKVSIQTQLERKTAEAELVGAPKTSSMSSISSIFGNAEVLEA
jgi:DNA polymerase III subunit gamma/tau